MRSLPAVLLGCAFLSTALACREVTGDRWQYTEAFVRGRVMTPSGAAAAGADLQFLVFRDRATTASCGAPAEASTVSFGRAGVDGRFAQRVASVPTGLAFEACLTVRAASGVDTAIASGVPLRFVPPGHALDTATVELTVELTVGR